MPELRLHDDLLQLQRKVDVDCVHLAKPDAGGRGRISKLGETAVAVCERDLPHLQVAMTGLGARAGTMWATTVPLNASNRS